MLPIAAAARRHRCRALLLPHPNRSEAAVVEGLELFPVRSLTEAVSALNDPAAFRASSCSYPACHARCRASGFDGDFADVHGQALARRALEIAAAGGHNVLMIGPPGAGKTMMARRVGDDPAAADLRRSARGDVHPLGRRPAADRHAAAEPSGRSARRITRSRTSPSSAAGQHPRPGEISLAHHGVLFLDEMPEFSRHVLEVLRQPVEEGIGPDRARGADGGLSRALHADRRDESVPMRLSRRPGAPLPVFDASRRRATPRGCPAHFAIGLT